MTENDITPLITLITAIVTAVLAFLGARAKYRTSETNIITSLTEAASQLVTPLALRLDQVERESRLDKQRIRDLNLILTRVQTQLDIYTAGTAMLITQIQAIGLNPVWIPPAPTPIDPPLHPSTDPPD